LKNLFYKFLLLVIFSSTSIRANNIKSFPEIIFDTSATLEKKKKEIIIFSESPPETDTKKLIALFDSLLLLDHNNVNELREWIKLAKTYSLRRIRRINEAVELLKSIVPGNDKELKFYTENCLARNYLGISDYSKALGYFQSNLTYYTTINKDLKKQVQVLSNIANCYRRMKMREQCLEFTMKSLEVAAITKDSLNTYDANSALSLYYLYIGDFEKADSVYNVLMNYKSILPQRALLAFYSNYGETKISLNQYNEAEKYVDLSYDISVSLRDTFWLAITLVNKGNIASNNKKYSLAVNLCKQAINFARIKQSLIWEKNACKCVYENSIKNNNFKEALEYYKNATEIKDSILSEKNQKDMTRKEFEFEYQIKVTADSIRQIEADKVKDAHILAQQSEIKQQRTQRIALIGGSVLVMIFAGFMFNRFKITKKQKTIIEKQKETTESQKNLLEEKQKEIFDSINYAKRIQLTLLAQTSFLKESLPEHFVLFKPKDIVSGDFYWAAKKEDLFYLAVCDSTGHGVPGAFMSLLNIGFLNEAVKEKNIIEPNEILNYVRERLITNISQEDQKDGMDAIIICINKRNNKITYSAANNTPILITDNKIVELEKDKMPVGKGESNRDFKLYTIPYSTNSSLYLYTDGMADQFGGPKGKKFKYKQLNDLLISISSLSLIEQKNELENSFTNWKGSLEQVDDVCLIGIRF